MKQNYKDVFTGVEQYEKRYHMQLNPDVVGVIQPPQKIPYATQPKLKVTLISLTASYFFEPYPITIGPQRVEARAVGYMTAITTSMVMVVSSRRIILYTMAVYMPTSFSTRL